MKIITIRQPWAYLIVHNSKAIENRRWNTNYRGPLGIHAAKAMTQGDFDDAMAFVDDAFPLEPVEMRRRRQAAFDAPRGGLVGECVLSEVIIRSSDPWFFGPYGFVLSHIKPVKFEPMRGQLGLWDG